MSAIDNVPTNKNFLSPLGFKFAIKRAPHINFFVQKANVPSLALPSIDIPTQFVPIPTNYTHVDYGRFEVTFAVDEDLKNYLEIHDWMRALGFPDNYDEHAALSRVPQYTGEGLVSDLSLIILNSNKRGNFEFTFRDAFPVSLSGMQFDTTRDDVQYVTAIAEFAYIMYDITKV